MWKRWSEKYHDLMVRTVILSKLGAFISVLIISIELIGFVYLITIDFNLYTEDIFYFLKMGLLKAFVTFTLGSRFLILFRRSPSRYLSSQVAWASAAFAFLIYWADSNNYWISDGAFFT